MTKGKTLQDKLARSLDQANRKEAAKPKAVKPKAEEEDGPKCTKLSISLFDADLTRLEAIRSYMAQRGEILSRSQAVKLALRTAPLSDALQEALDAVRQEDGRKWPS